MLLLPARYIAPHETYVVFSPCCGPNGRRACRRSPRSWWSPMPCCLRHRWHVRRILRRCPTAPPRVGRGRYWCGSRSARVRVVVFVALSSPNRRLYNRVAPPSPQYSPTCRSRISHYSTISSPMDRPLLLPVCRPPAQHAPGPRSWPKGPAMARQTARMEHDTRVPVVGNGAIMARPPAWFGWLERAPSGALGGPAGRFTTHQGTRPAGGTDWTADRLVHDAVRRSDLGQAQDLTRAQRNRPAKIWAAAMDSPTLAPLPPPAALAAPPDRVADRGSAPGQACLPRGLASLRRGGEALCL